MPSPSLILSVALAASFVPLSNLSRSYIHKTRKSQMQPFADTLAYLAKDMRLRLLQERVVPEVIADAPPRPVAVFYPYATVLMGNEIHSSALRHVPKFSFDADPDKRYSLVFLGPDYPSRSNPYERNHVLWFVTNYARNSTHEVRPICRVSYGLSHLTRNSGRQRFVFLVYEQPDDTDWSQTIMDPPTPKINFMLDSYVSRNRLTLAAVNYFIVDMEKEATGGSGASDNKSTPSGRITDEDKESDAPEAKGSDTGKTSVTDTTNGDGDGADKSREGVTGAGGKHVNAKTAGAGESGSGGTGKSTSSGAKGGASRHRGNKKKTSEGDKSVGAVNKKSNEIENKLDERKANGAQNMSSKSDEHINDPNESCEDRERALPNRDKEQKVSSEGKILNTADKKSRDEDIKNKNAEVASNEKKTGSGEVRTGIDESAIDTGKKRNDVGEMKGRNTEDHSGQDR